MSHPQGAIRLLLIEDVAADAERALYQFRRAGIAFEARRVETGEALREALGQFRPDAVLSDFTLPQFDGMSALRICREQAPEIPFVFLSGTIGEERAVAALQAGASDYVLKENLTRLVPAVQRAIVDAGVRAERAREQAQIARERRILADVRDRADLVIDTSLLKPADLKERLARMVTGQSFEDQMTVEVVSFGFKHGVPLDADIVLDVRFLPNPFYEPGLRPQTGLDEDVARFVMGHEDATEWLTDTVQYLRRWLPAYARTGRSRLSIAVGCTGGQHRSVALAEALGAGLRQNAPAMTVRHRDLPLANRTASEALTTSTP